MAGMETGHVASQCRMTMSVWLIWQLLLQIRDKLAESADGMKSHPPAEGDYM